MATNSLRIRFQRTKVYKKRLLNVTDQNGCWTVSSALTVGDGIEITKRAVGALGIAIATLLSKHSVYPRIFD